MPLPNESATPATPATTAAELALLGPPALTVGSRGGPAIGPGKSLALLAYLAVRRSVRRDELISLLWGDMPEDQARNAFRQALHRIRKAVGPEIVQSDRDSLVLGPAPVVTVDRDRFLAACDAERWSEAVSNYTGDFLEGFDLDEAGFDRWADAERMHLRGRFQTALRQSGEAALRAGDTVAAIQHSARLAASAPFEPEAALFQANVLVAAGKPADALSTLRQFVGRLHAELELPPSPAVQSLINRLERSAEQNAGGLPGLAPSEKKTNALVGRSPEMARLLSGVAAAKAERGSTFVLEAEAGMGRTRLLDELRSRVRDLGGVLVLRGHERATTSVVPYAAIAEALRPLARAPGVSGASRHLLAEAARLLPELRDSFDLPDVEPVEDAASRLRFFEGVAAAVDAAAYEQPLLILLDDLHHASAPSLDLLAYLTGRLRTSPVMFVLSVRSDRSAALERVRGMAQEDGAAGTIALAPLSADEIRALVTPLLPPGARGDDVDRVVRQAQGRPLLAIDLARRAAAGESPSESPMLLRDALWARLQAASPSQRRVFFAAALLDRVASVRLLAAAAHLPESATLEALQSLRDAGLLRPEGDGYVVAHHSTVGFVGDASGLAGRALLAGWAADALAAESTDVDAELAHLYSIAGRSALAFTHARAAAFAAAAVGATAEATHHLSVALSFAPDDAERARIESLLAVYGFGTLRLPGQVAPAPVEELADVEAIAEPMSPPADAAPRSTPSAGEAGVIESRRTSPHQWYMSIALSLIVILLGILVRRQTAQPRLAPARSDSLIVARRDASTGETSTFAVLSEDPRGGLVARTGAGDRAVAWAASVAAPWADALVSPDGAHVAMSQVTAHGKDLYVVSADRRDTLALAVGGGDNIALGWSPDSRALLVSRARALPDGSYDSDLYAYPVQRGATPVPIDTSSTRSIAEARWAPTGLSVAWVARVGATRQRDVYVSRADGSGVRNITSSSADDFGIAWSPDASLLAFTSTRSGGPRIYTYDFENDKLWTVSDRDGEDHATFSPDGRSIAFVATRDGDAGIYARPALGGTARRLTPPGAQFDIVGWSARPAGWVDRMRILGPTTLAVGDSADLTVLALAPGGAAVTGTTPTWTVDPARTAIDVHQDRPTGTLRVVARREGNVRVIAAIRGWRADTVTLIVGAGDLSINDDFSRGIVATRWTPLGEPAPYVGRDPLSAGRFALFPNGDLEWESGLLSRSTYQLAPGISIDARILAPFAGRASPASVTVGLVSVAPIADARAPQLQPLIGVSWDGQSAAFHYVAGRESFTDLAAARTDSLSHAIGMRITSDSTVAFSIDGRERWRSSLRYGSEVGRRRVQLWLGGHATTNHVAISDVLLENRAARP